MGIYLHSRKFHSIKYRQQNILILSRILYLLSDKPRSQAWSIASIWFAMLRSLMALGPDLQNDLVTLFAISTIVY